MAWRIQCSNEGCKDKDTWAGNIVYLINDRLDKDGWILCGHCGNPGYIKKSFALQEKGEFWKPYLRGVIRLGNVGDVYQPFVFLVSYTSDETPRDVWFCYYKDTRSSGGRLKMGYGPGGPPVLKAKQVVGLIDKMRDVGVSFE